jgi:hypothetical protein
MYLWLPKRPWGQQQSVHSQEPATRYWDLWGTWPFNLEGQEGVHGVRASRKA